MHPGPPAGTGACVQASELRLPPLNGRPRAARRAAPSRESGDPVTFAPLDSRPRSQSRAGLRGNDDIYVCSFCNRFLKDQTDADQVPAVVGSVLLDAELSSVRIVPVF